jgi:hypothetical protein
VSPLGVVVRAFLIVGGLLALFGGAGVMLFAPDAWPAGLELLVIGAILVLVVAFERGRYRSARAEEAGLPTGPGGGETAEVQIEPRFRPTAELFVDPTSGHRMRVLVDPATGERRYVAEA